MLPEHTPGNRPAVAAGSPLYTWPMAIGSDALEPGQRELLRRLVREQRIEEVADARETSVEQVEADAREALVALDPALAALVVPNDRRLVAAELLHRGDERAAVAEILDRSPDARRWALWVGEALRVIAPDARPAQLPSAGTAAVAQAPHDAGEMIADAANLSDDGAATRDMMDPRGAGAATARDTTEASDDSKDALSRRDRAILAATVAMGFVLLTLGIALS